jgi:hypothetical protein
MKNNDVRTLKFGIISVVLSFLTKGTFVFYFGIICLFLLFLISNQLNFGVQLFKLFFRSLRSTSFILLSVLLLIPSSCRNLRTSGNLLGPDNVETQLYRNNRISLKVGVSNTLKNLSTQFVTPIEYVNNLNINFVSYLHILFRLPSPDCNENNWKNTRFILNHKLKKFFRSETIPNILLLLISFTLFVLTIFVICFVNDDITIYWDYLKFTLLNFLFLFLFSLIFRWQPWHTRLLFPIFLSQAYLVINFLKNFKIHKFVNWMIISIGVIIVLINTEQPLLHFSKLNDTNFIKLDNDNFIKRAWNDEFQYSKINSLIGNSKEVGLCFSWEDERMFPYMYNARITQNKFHYLGMFNNPSKKYIKDEIILDYLDYIITNSRDVNYLHHRSVLKYYKMIYRTPDFLNNQYWYLYERIRKS